MKVYEQGAVTIYQSVLWKTTSTIYEGEQFILLVDPTWLPQEVEEIRSHVERIRKGRPLYLLFTHGDFDHIIGYGAFPDAHVIGSEKMQHHPKKDYKLGLIADFDREYYIDRSYPITFPTIDHIISRNGQQLMIGETTLTFYLAPGHTPDGLFTVIEPAGVWITGDYLSDFELPYLFDSAKAYLMTLDQAEEIVDRHSINLLIPGHGAWTTNPNDMRERTQQGRAYLTRLIEAVRMGDALMMEKIGQEMDYPSSFTRECHQENIAIIKKELAFL